MKTTFLNSRSSHKDERTRLRKTGRKHLESRAEDFRRYSDYTEYEQVPQEPGAFGKCKLGHFQWVKFFEETGSFYDYGLAVDYVTPGTFNNKAGYLRYQLSYGGPSEEIRFYFTPKATEAYKIEFVYLDWGVGVGFDVTNEDWAKWLFDWFNEAGTAEAEMNKAFENL